MSKQLVTRIPSIEDSSAIFQLISNTKPLDVNSEYLYILLCDHFKHTCVIAELEDQVVGFLSAYLIPHQLETLFIWQVAVDGGVRGKGVSKFMFQNLLTRENISHVKRIEATVSPSNIASQKMFSWLSRILKTTCVNTPYYDQSQFSSGNHEAEDLYVLDGVNLKQYQGEM